MTVMIVGEAWGREEEERHEPFVGASGRFLHSMLRATGFNKSDCYLTNVFNFRPRPSNDIINLCGTKAEGISGFPSIGKGKYVLKQYAPELERLFEEVRKVKPIMVLALGATASWALLKTTGIKRIRGTPALSHLGMKVFPTYHPAAVLREFKLRPIIYADLIKAAHEATFPEIIRPKRELWIEPTFNDLLRFELQFIKNSRFLSIDIETSGDQITLISFAPRPDIALVVPFYDKRKADRNYWPTLEEEVQVWKWVKRICALSKQVVGQNFMYDMGFLWRSYKIPVPGAAEDTMLLHHALQPEMEKSLEFLASVYTTEQPWKFMRTRGTRKKED